MSSLFSISRSRDPFDADNLEELMGTKQSPGQRCGVCLAGPIGIALLIIGCVAAAGHLSSVAAGGCVVGLSVPLVLINLAISLCAKNDKECAGPIISTILTIAWAVLGALAIAGIITPTVLGWCVIGPSVAALAIACCCICCCVSGMICCVAADAALT